MVKLLSSIFLCATLVAYISQAEGQEAPVRGTKPAVLPPIIPAQTRPDVKTNSDASHESENHDTLFESNNGGGSGQPSILPILKPAEPQHTRESRDSPQSPQQTQDVPSFQANAAAVPSSSAVDLTFTTAHPQDQERQHTDSRFCTKIQEPLCASDGKTYGNKCLFNLEKRTNSGLTVTRSGEC